VNSLLFTWQFNLIGHILAVVSFTQFYKLAIRKISKDGAATVLLEGVAGLMVLVWIPFFKLSFPSDPLIYLLLSAACVFYAICDRLNTTTRKNMEVSTFVILDRSATIFLILSGMIFFRETLTWQKAIGAGLIIGGNILALYRQGKFVLDKYVLLNLIANLAYALAVSIDIDNSQHFNLPIYIAFTLIIPASLIAIFDRIKPADIKELLKSKDRPYFLLTSLSWSLLILFVLRAYRFGEVTVIASLSATTVVLNVLIAFFLFNEKDYKYRKLMAALIAVLGVYLTVR